MSSWPAACGIRCVKPSSATVSPSCTGSRTASARGTSSANLRGLMRVEVRRASRWLRSRQHPARRAVPDPPSVSTGKPHQPLERERVPGPALDGDPAELGELVDHRLPAETSPPGVLDAAERHLRLVADGLVVDVDDARLEQLRE